MFHCFTNGTEEGNRSLIFGKRLIVLLVEWSNISFFFKRMRNNILTNGVDLPVCQTPLFLFSDFIYYSRTSMARTSLGHGNLFETWVVRGTEG